MNDTLFGIPLVFWGVGCLGIGVAYFSFWPRPDPQRTIPRTNWQHLVLRYFHSLVWILLAIGCFAAAADMGDLGRWIALSAIPVYGTFMWIFIRDRRRELDQIAATRHRSAGQPAKDTSQ